MLKIKVSVLPQILDKIILLDKDVKSYHEMKDEELVLAVQNGEVDAFSHIVERYQGKLFAYVMRLINHREDAYDVTQDVFLKTYRYLNRFDTDRKFSSWIYRIAHNESVNWLKKKTRVKIESIEVHQDYGRQFENGHDMAKEYMLAEEQKVVRMEISKLPKKYETVMYLRYLQELSYEEIAKRLDKPINTVGTLINRAKKRLAMKLKQI